MREKKNVHSPHTTNIVYIYWDNKNYSWFKCELK